MGGLLNFSDSHIQTASKTLSSPYDLLLRVSDFVALEVIVHIV